MTRVQQKLACWESSKGLHFGHPVLLWQSWDAVGWLKVPKMKQNWGERVKIGNANRLRLAKGVVCYRTYTEHSCSCACRKYMYFGCASLAFLGLWPLLLWRSKTNCNSGLPRCVNLLFVHLSGVFCVVLMVALSQFLHFSLYFQFCRFFISTVWGVLFACNCHCTVAPSAKQ